MPHHPAPDSLLVAVSSKAPLGGERQSRSTHEILADVHARALLARLGLSPNLLKYPGDYDPYLSRAQHEAALSRLRAEHRRLARHARARHPAYDLDRHLAVRSLLAVLDPGQDSRPPVLRCKRPRGPDAREPSQPS